MTVSHFSKLSRFVAAGASMTLMLSLGGAAAYARGYTVEILPPCMYQDGPHQIAPTGINDEGVIIGHGLIGSNVDFPVVIKNGVASPLPIPAYPKGVAWSTTNPISINRSGQIISKSYLYDAANNFVDSSMVMYNPPLNSLTVLPTVLPAKHTFFTGLSDTGVAVGFDSGESGGVAHGLQWKAGNVSILPGLKANDVTLAYAISSSGHIAGGSGDRMVIWKDGQPVDVGPVMYWCYYINDHDQILAQLSSGPPQPFTIKVMEWSQGAWTDIGNLDNKAFIFADGFNNKGWIVGSAYNFNDSHPRIFLRADGPLVDINTLLPAGSGYDVQAVEGINNRDQIVAMGSLNGSSRYSYSLLLTPALAAKPSLNAVSLSSNGTAGGDITLTVTGSGFENDTTASVDGGSPLVTKYISSTKLLATVPREALNGVSQLSVTVYTPPAGGGVSNALVTDVAFPSIISATPNRIDPGAVNARLTVVGLNFDPDALVTINDTYTVKPTNLSSTKLTALLPSSITGTAGSYYIRVVNVADNKQSAPMRFTVARPTPVISALSPNRIPMGLASLSLYVNGTGFTAGSKVTFNGGALVTPTSFTANRLVVSVPATVRARSGSYPIRIVNSFADGGSSEQAILSVVVRPTLTSVTPSAIKASASSVTVTLTGSNFEAGSVVTINDTNTVTPTFVSAAKLTAVLPSAVSSKAGAYYVRVVNPGYANVSGPKSLIVTAK